MSTYEVSQSSLLSLKAEILRKQEEASKVKHENLEKIRNLKKSFTLLKKNKGVEDRERFDKDPEEENLLKKSRETLEAKAKLYEKLSKQSRSEDDVESESRYLVQFGKKADENLKDHSDEGAANENKSDSDGYNSEDYAADNADEEWIEYVDALGRTRTCLKKDLEHLKADDAKLRDTLKVRNDKEDERDEHKISSPKRDSSSSPPPVTPTTASGELESSDMRRELLRQKWEEEEDELRNKTNIHYQDILFDEARTHGVGYFRFSKDETERAKQQADLKKLRTETHEQQKKSQELRAMREKQMAARLKAARNRKRARMGLPPEEDEPEAAPAPVPVHEEAKEPSVAEKKPTEMDIAREKLRKKHIRPWDIGKEGVPEHYEMTQEEWVKKKRQERPAEFAPPEAFKKDSHKFPERSHTAVSRESRDRFQNINPYKMEPTPIVNECEYVDTEPESDRLLDGFNAISDSRKKVNGRVKNIRERGVEIPPPPTFELYGPSETKKPKISSSRGSLEDSINAGLQFLRTEFEKKSGRSHNRDDEMFLE